MTNGNPFESYETRTRMDTKRLGYAGGETHRTGPWLFTNDEISGFWQQGVKFFMH